ncbi:hypothetical protein [Streptomyces sp. NPDC021020]|uniref:hypothetical protein n=1 Tax=Streptomyces sp. NPDC021020 TaxID=3365109 RepID=UPI0037915B0D
MSRGERVARGCAFTAFGVVGLVLAVLLYGMWEFREQTKPVAPPDVAAFAHSPAARTADAAAARSASADLGALASALPWAEPLGTSVSDLCRSRPSGSVVGSRGNWSLVECVRFTVAYVAFDGDVRARLRVIDSAVAAQGWEGGSTLTESAADPNRTTPLPSPSTAPPGWGRISVVDARPPYQPTGNDADPHLRVSVAGAPDDPEADTGGFQDGVGSQRYKDRGTFYVTWQPLSTHAVAQAAFAAHHYVAAFSVVTRYIVQSPPGTPTTPTTPTTYDPGPCLSGSHKCF